jgi:hypothetical protein
VSKRVKPDTRLKLLAALDKVRSARLAYLANEIDKTCAATHQVLTALADDGLVERHTMKREVWWVRTDKPVPETFTPTEHSKQPPSARRAPQRGALLAAALGSRLPPKTPPATKIRRFSDDKGGRGREI